MVMGLFNELTLMESQKRADLEVGYAIASINEVYNEWKKIHRRRNAVNIVTTSVNKLSTISPDTVDFIHDTAKLKLATIIMRCMDIPPWMKADSKRITYRRLLPLILKIQNVSPNTGTGGSLREVIMTRLSASVCYNTDAPNNTVFVGYEPVINKKYLRFIYGDEQPEHVCKMQTLSMSEDFDTLLNTIKINHEKACAKYIGNTDE